MCWENNSLPQGVTFSEVKGWCVLHTDHLIAFHHSCAFVSTEFIAVSNLHTTYSFCTIYTPLIFIVNFYWRYKKQMHFVISGLGLQLMSCMWLQLDWHYLPSMLGNISLKLDRSQGVRLEVIPLSWNLRNKNIFCRLKLSGTVLPQTSCPDLNS